MRVLYDGSFEGFLCIVHSYYYDKLRPTSILQEASKTLCFEESVTIVSDTAKASKVLVALKEKFTKPNFEKILTIFMCDTKEFELDLLHFIIIGFKNQKELGNINHASIFAINCLIKEYYSLYHKMSGFLRFVELDDGTLYARVESKFNILMPLARHFNQRFNNQSFIIHDLERKLAYLHTEQFQGIQEILDYQAPKVSENEEKFATLWQKFFESISIKQRHNPKLQQQFVPLIYRTFMTEFG